MKKENLFKAVVALAIGASLGLTVISCSNSGDDSSKSSQSSKVEKAKKKTKKSANENTAKLKTTDIKLSMSEALNKFDQKFKDTKIKSIDLQAEGNSYVYEIDGMDNNKEYTAKIDANNGKILHSESKKLDLDDRLDKTIDLDNVISRKQATKIAEKKVKGTTEEWKLEQDHNKAYWEITVNDGSKKHEVKIDAETKKVVEVDHDDE